MPDPITAPMPSAVRLTGPSVLFNACSGRSDSWISLSMDLVRKICLASALTPQTVDWFGEVLLRTIAYRLDVHN